MSASSRSTGAPVKVSEATRWGQFKSAGQHVDTAVNNPFEAVTQWCSMGKFNDWSSWNVG